MTVYQTQVRVRDVVFLKKDQGYLQGGQRFWKPKLWTFSASEGMLHYFEILFS